MLQLVITCFSLLFFRTGVLLMLVHKMPVVNYIKKKMMVKVRQSRGIHYFNKNSEVWRDDFIETLYPGHFFKVSQIVEGNIVLVVQKIFISLNHNL